jgi:hypothetical protein
MKMPAAARPFAFVALCAAPTLLAGCSGVTYGTGTRTEMQTINDITGILSLSGPPKQEVDTTPRGGIVVPPATAKAALPAPVDGTTTASIDPADWPNDPDAAAKKKKADEDAAPLVDASTRAQTDPGFRLSKEYWDKQKQQENASNNADQNMDASARVQKQLQNVQIDKNAFKQAKSERGGSLDADGKPVRRYLTEPPAEYREPDPSAAVDPVAPPEAKKKFSLSNLWPF